MAVGFIIRVLEGDPLPTDMFEVFFQKDKNDLCLYFSSIHDVGIQLNEPCM
jgi:hypothetical protein